jgi:class 3 adenylate cyclase
MGREVVPTGKATFALFTLLALACGLVAHAAAPPVVFAGQKVIAFRQLEAMPDPDGRLTINDVASPGFSDRFLPAAAFDDKVAQSNVYWMRITIENPRATERTVALFPINTWGEVQLYSAGEAFRMRRSGIDVPIAERDIEVTHRAESLIPYFAVRAVLPPSSATTVYLRASSNWRYGAESQLAVDISDLDLLRAEERLLRPLAALIFGILAALALYHLMLFFGLRDSGYGFYVMHITGIALIGPTIFGMTAEYLTARHPGWALDAIVLQKALVSIGLAQFTRIFLDTRRVHRRLDLALRVVIVACVLVVIVAPFGSYRINNFAMTPLLQLAYLLALVTGISSLIKRNPLARYFVAANVFTFAGLAAAIAGEVLFLQEQLWTSLGPQIGTALEALLLSRGLAHRMNLLKAALAESRIAEERLRREREEERRLFVEEQKTVLERKVAERTAELSSERERSEALLRNILPAAIAEELKRDGRSAPRRHEEVSILFTDFAGFTQTVSTVPPQRMVAELDAIFAGFDEIVERNGLEKIKTIGDAYFAAAGVPEPLDDHADKCVAAALEMQRWMAERNATASIKWGLRVGIHSGPAVSGVVGRRKYAYDIWGDTVNIASRMESSGEPGRVNISAYTYDLVRGRFDCEYRGKVEAKGKGAIDMYFVLARRSPDTNPGSA